MFGNPKARDAQKKKKKKNIFPSKNPFYSEDIEIVFRKFGFFSHFIMGLISLNYWNKVSDKIMCDGKVFMKRVIIVHSSIVFLCLALLGLSECLQ